MRTTSLLLAVASLATFIACDTTGQDDAFDADPKGRISGTVVDVQQAPLADVAVTAQGQTVYTDEDGLYTLEMVEPAQEIMVLFEHDDYSEKVRYTNIVSWETVPANATLKKHDWVRKFNPVFGGSFSEDGMSIEIPAGAIVDENGNEYTDEVEVSMTYFDPYSDELAAAPGDLTALVKAAGGNAKDVLEEAQLLSFGMVEVQFTSQDRKKLTLGEPVEVEIPISQSGVPDFYQVEEGDEIVLWDWSNGSGAWLEEGSGRVTSDESGNSTYSFSTMSPGGKNPDSPIEYTCVEGKVVDTLDFPVRGSEVQCRGQLTSSTVTADENGDFECTVAVGDLVYIVPSTYVANQTWYGFDSLTTSSQQCNDVGDVPIEVCRESGVMMADNVEAYSDTGSWEADNLRAWFWEAKGYVEYCHDPFQDIPMDSCQMMNIEVATSWFPDMDPETGMMTDTRSVGPWLSLETPRDTYELSPEDNGNGVPVYHWDRHTEATTGQDGTVSIDDPSDVDLQGGDVITATAPGNASDYMGPIVHEDWIHLPSEIDLGASSGSISVRSGQSFTLTYDGADNNPDGILGFALTGKQDTAMVCRFRDDGSLNVSGQHTSQMSPSDEGAISFYKADIGWKAGPDGLPIRMQGLSGVTMSLDLN